MKIGLYSVTYAGMWYDGPALSITEFVDRAGKFGFEGIELDCRAPHALPYLMSESDRKETRDYIGEAGIELSALAANNDFSSPVVEHRDANVQMVVEMIHLARDLGAPVLRVFTAWRGSSRLNGRTTYEVARPGYDMAFPQTPEMDRWKYCLEAFRTVTRFAEDAGVVLALQNHPPVVFSGEIAAGVLKPGKRSLFHLLSRAPVIERALGLEGPKLRQVRKHKDMPYLLASGIFKGGKGVPEPEALAA